MKTLAPETPTPESTGRPRRWLLPVIAAVVLLAIAGGVWAILAADGSQRSELDAATEVFDEWIAAWNADDPNAVAEAFTADAVIQDFDDQLSGRDAIVESAREFNDIVLEVRRLGEGQSTDGGTFVFPLGFDFDFGTGFAGTDEGEVEVTITDGLMSRLEWLYRELVG